MKLGVNFNAKLDVYESTSLHYAAFHGKTEVVRLLIRSGANINATNRDLKTPLHMAASNGYASTARCLVEGGANLMAKNVDGLTPLDCAEQWGNTETSSALKQVIADIESNPAKQGWKIPFHKGWRVQSANRFVNHFDCAYLGFRF
jgi:ankyrin repeat protein